MPTAKPAAEGTPAASSMPTPVKVAAFLLALLGTLLLLNAALTWITQEVVIDRLVDAGADRDEAAETLLLFGIAYTVIGGTALVAAVNLARRRLWARALGTLVASLLAVVTVLSMVMAGGATPLSLLLLVSSVAVLTSLHSRPTTEWLH